MSVYYTMAECIHNNAIVQFIASNKTLYSHRYHDHNKVLIYENEKIQCTLHKMYFTTKSEWEWVSE